MARIASFLWLRLETRPNLAGRRMLQRSAVTERDPLTEPVFVAQLLTYLRVTGLRRGLLLNFNKEVLKAGIKRVTRFD
jgi:hypothetical protein